MGLREDQDEARRREAREALARVAGEGDIFASSARADAATSAAFSERESDADAVEIWGRRIGRGLGIVVALILVVHLVTTHGSR